MMSCFLSFFSSLPCSVVTPDSIQSKSLRHMACSWHSAYKRRSNTEQHHTILIGRRTSTQMTHLSTIFHSLCTSRSSAHIQQFCMFFFLYTSIPTSLVCATLRCLCPSREVASSSQRWSKKEKEIIKRMCDDDDYAMLKGKDRHMCAVSELFLFSLL